MAVPDEPLFVKSLPTPAKRVRYTPFGTGLMSMPQRKDNSLTLWNMHSQPSLDSSNTELEEVYKFEGHRNAVREFVWRKRGEEYQLVTWSTDQTLRVWPVPLGAYQSVNYHPVALERRRNSVVNFSAGPIMEQFDGRDYFIGPSPDEEGAGIILGISPEDFYFGDEDYPSDSDSGAQGPIFDNSYPFGIPYSLDAASKTESSNTVPFPCLCSGRFSPSGHLVVVFSNEPRPKHDLSHPRSFDGWDKWRRLVSSSSMTVVREERQTDSESDEVHLPFWWEDDQHDETLSMVR